MALTILGSIAVLALSRKDTLGGSAGSREAIAGVGDNDTIASMTGKTIWKGLNFMIGTIKKVSSSVTLNKLNSE